MDIDFMNLSISVAAQNRHFPKNVRRVRSAIDVLCEEFAAVHMVNPIHEAILIGLTDSKPSDFFEIILNRDGCFQILAGVDANFKESTLSKAIILIIAKAIAACPFSEPDRSQFKILVEKWRGASD